MPPLSKVYLIREAFFMIWLFAI